MFVQQGVLRVSNGNQLGNASSTTSSTATTGASGQTVLTPTGGTANYGVGQMVFGSGIAADTFITAVSGTTITLSANTTAANPTITTSAGGILMSNVGSALELTGGATVADGIFINASNNATNNGINGGGAIRSTTGTNTVSGLITIATPTADGQMRAVTLAADAGATLNITGGVLGQVGTAGVNRHSWVGIGGEGTTNITTTGFTNTGTLGIYQLNKFGAGTLNVQVANAFSGRDVFVKQGTLSLNGAGTFSTLGSGQGTLRTIYVHDVGTLVLDNSGSNVSNRLGNAALSFQGSDFQIIGSSSATTTETTTGAMTLNAGASVFTLDAGVGQQLNFTTAAVTRNAGSTLLIRADGFGNAAGANVATIQGSTATYTFTGQLGATGTTNKSILGWAIGDTSVTGGGIGFVTADSAAAGANAGTNRLRLLSGSEQVTILSTAGTNVNLSSAANLAASLSINSLQLGSGGGITLSGGAVLTLESGALLVQAGNSGISGTGTLTAASNRELIVYTVGDLTLGVAITGTSGGLTKSGEGTLTLAAGNTFAGTVTINQGTLMIGGGDFSLTPNQTLQLLGGNLDLNGTVQNINNLQAQTGALAVNDGFAPNTAGYVINTSASQATLALTTANVSFRGAIGNNNAGQSNIAVVRSGAAGSTVDWNLYGDNTYTGATLLNGGRTQLIDGGRLSGTSSIEISNATLLVTTGNITVESVSLTDRINDAASITLNGAMFQWRTRASLYSTEQLGAVKLGYGSSIIDFAEPGSNVNQSDVTFASFAQLAGQHGTVRFVNIDGNISALQRLFISNLNGVATTNLGDGLTNNLIGGWATFEREFASYTPSQGVAGLTNNGYAGYSPNTIFTGTATDNVRILLPVAGSTTTLTADATLNSLNLQANTGATGSSVLDLGGKTLTLASGGLIASPIATAASANSISIINGSLTAGTTSSPADLYLHALSWLNNQADNTGNADVTVSANIVNNAAGGAVALVIDGNQGRGTLNATNDVFITGSNTYTGGTWVNSGRIVLNNAAADGVTTFAVPGNLTISGGYSSNPAVYTDRNTQVILGASNQMANTGVVTILGGATFDLNNFNQTVGGVVFNNNGGNSPVLNVGTGSFTLNGNLTATSQNLGAVSQLGVVMTASTTNGNSTVTVTSTAGLTVGTAVVGLGVPANATIASILNATQFTLSVNANATATTNQLAFLGAGAIDLNGAVRTFEINPVQWNGEILSPTLSTLDINAPLTGAGASGINKTGAGNLTLKGASTYAGTTTVSAGKITYGVTDALPTLTALTVLTGGTVELNGFNGTVGSLASENAVAGGIITNTASGTTSTFTAGGDNTSTIFGGTITNSSNSTLNFSKAGTGILTLTGANTYTGRT
ncbi:beta strand repeat-containing protein [Prosthecobacter sp.]|uniref:beta strand repeat-containing protein n=1 Tax=Prosthecobacter sp. TaxID=1965333 RepID=UPI003784BD0A